MADNLRLADIAAAVSDGADVDWDAAESSASDDAARAVLRDLKVLARVGALHRTGSTAGSPASSLEDPLTPAADPHLTAPAWGPLRLLDRIGSGRFGDVYRAWDPRLERDVALKLLRTDRAVPATAVVREARLLARVRHPNVVTVHGADVIDLRVGLWMEFVRGTTLAAAVREHGPFAVQEACAIGRDLCRALAAVHRSGLLHRDIKPENVMREPGGRIVLMDFGAGAEESSRRAVHGVAGTPLYLAPELFEGMRATPQSDIYSLGVLLYFIVAGTHPVGGRTIGDVRTEHAEGRRTRLREARPDIPPAFAEAIERALDPDPSQRYEHAEAFESALAQSLEAEVPPAARPRMSKRRFAVIASAIAAALVTAGALAWWRAGPWTLRSSAGDATSRRVAVLDWPFASVSPDGRLLLYQKSESRHLWVKDLATGAVRALVEEPANVSFAWSQDSRQIAFATIDGDNVRVQTVGVAGGPRRVVWAGRRGGHPVPIDWTPDGRYLLCDTWSRGIRQLALLTVADGSLHTIAAIPAQADLARVSPDGRFAAYAAALEGNWDLFVVPLDGSSAARRITDHAGTDRYAAWSHDGRWLIFASERSGDTAIWALPFDARGQPDSPEPTLLSKLSAGGRVDRVTTNGELVAFRRTRLSQVCLLAVDGAAGAPAGAAPSCLSEATSSPAWGSRGSLFFHRQDRDAWNSSIVERDLETRNERVVRIPAPYVAGFMLPSSESVLFYNGGGSPPRGVYEYAVERGTVTPVWITDDPVNPPLTWSPDGRRLLLTGAPQPDRRLPIQVLRRGDAAPLAVAFAGSRPFPQWSPDGRRIAYSDRECLMMVDAAGGKPRAVTCAAPARPPSFTYVPIGGLGWSPDGTSIAWVVHEEAARRVDLWFVNVASGRHVSWPGEGDYRSWPADPRWSPNGRSVAFTMDYRLEIEIVLMAGRLPALATARR